MGSQGAAEGEGEARGGGRGESGERSGVQARPTLESTAPKAGSRSREVVTLDEAPRISPRVSPKLPSSASSSLSLVITALNDRTDSRTDISHGHWHARLQRRNLRVHWLPRCQHQSQSRDDEPRDSKRRCDTMLDFASAGSYHGPTTEDSEQKQSQQDRERRLQSC